MNPAIIIPTFHTLAAEKRRVASDLFDHPTPIDMPSDLARCLDSLERVKGIGQIIVMVACEGGVEKEAARKVQDIVAAHPGLHTLVIAGANGVVIITTKRGKEGKATVNFDAYYGFSGSLIIASIFYLRSFVYDD